MYILNQQVLILVLIEHAQRIRQEFVNDRRHYVFILILMEHAQRVKFFINLKLICFMVLILVLMEDAQRVYS